MRIVLAALCIGALAIPATAQTVAADTSIVRNDDAAFDLVGLRLGMTADEARAVLNESGFTFSEHGSWGHRGYDGLVRSEANRLRQPVPELPPTTGPEEINGEDAAGNRIVVRFTAMRDGPIVSEVVLRFNRNTTNIETLREDIFARYGEPSAANAYGDDYRWCLPGRPCPWRPDASGPHLGYDTTMGHSLTLSGWRYMVAERDAEIAAMFADPSNERQRALLGRSN
jgi:hypothetical protein